MEMGQRTHRFARQFESCCKPFLEVKKEFSMKTITRDIRLKAPSEMVFNFVVEPHNLPEIWPNIVEIKNVKQSKSNEGFNFNWDYKMAGEQFEGNCETIEYQPYDRLVVRTSKGLDGTFTWIFRPTGQETQVTLK